MSKFELFCLIFLALDADWDNTHDEELGKYLSDANPFLFAENTSAVQSVYEKFADYLRDKVITKDNSFALALDYVQSLDAPAVATSFLRLTEEQWLNAVKDYLSNPHKGQEESDADKKITRADFLKSAGKINVDSRAVKELRGKSMV